MGDLPDWQGAHSGTKISAMESVSPVQGAAVESADPQGNRRLTAMTGAVLLVFFTAEVITTLLMGSLFSLHFFLGMVLIGPVCLKVGSTVWRFIRYYTGSQPYVRRGPPATLQRVLGPVLILLSLTVLGSGVMLAVTGPGGVWDMNVGDWQVASADQRDLSVLLFQMRGQAA